MDQSFFDLVEFLKRPSIAETFVDILLCAAPIWFAVMIGVVIGWSWRPRWTGIVFLGFRSKLRLLWTAPAGFSVRQLWLAFTALSAFSIGRSIWSNFRGNGTGPAGSPSQSGNVAAAISKTGEESSEVGGSSVEVVEKEQDVVTQKDLEHLLHLLEGKNGTMDWQSLMQTSAPNMSHQAWRYEPEGNFHPEAYGKFSLVGMKLAYLGFAHPLMPGAKETALIKPSTIPRMKELAWDNIKILSQTGPLVYLSKTVFEDATPELVRDFYWDDEFRVKWDPMLGYCKILEECPHNGIVFSHWIKKFPFFCSDRDYIIARRMWEAGNTFYCVTKGVPYPSLPKRDKPRRVEHYFDSWVIKPVESQKDGQLSACEVNLIHYEDMGLPKDLEKLTARHVMPGVVKKLHSGMRTYQNNRKTDPSLSRCARMARITTKLSSEINLDSSGSANREEEKALAIISNSKQEDHGIDWKWMVIGGTVALLLGKGLLLGGGHRKARR